MIPNSGPLYFDGQSELWERCLGSNALLKGQANHKTGPLPLCAGHLNFSIMWIKYPFHNRKPKTGTFYGLATSCGHIESVKALLAGGASPYIKGFDGAGLYDMLRYSNHPEIGNIIREALLEDD